MIIRKNYYNNVDVLFELIHQHKYRETFFLPYNDEMKPSSPIRWLKCDCIKFLQRNWKQYKFLDRKMNLYHSMATYDQLPVFSYIWNVKSQQQEIWANNYQKYLVALDCFIETDSDDLGYSLMDTIEIKELLDKYVIVYAITFSGSKGFHVIIPYNEFKFLCLNVYEQKKERHFIKFREFLRTLPVPQEQLSNTFDLVLLYKTINLRLSTMFALDTIDTTISDILRVKKTAYSIDVKSGNVALPIDDDQLYSFDLGLVRPETVLKNGVHKRGLLWRNTHICKLKRAIGMRHFLTDLGILQKNI